MSNIFNLLLVILQAFSASASNQLLTNRGSFKVSSVSTKPNAIAEVIYNFCLPAVPDFVHATARPSNPSLPHRFNLNILVIKKLSFAVRLERVDQPIGWDTMVTVDWFMYIGVAVVHNGLVFWLPQHVGVITQNREEAATYCTERGDKLPDIADRETYELIYSYVRKNFVYQDSGGWYINIWLASDYNPKTGEVTQSNGEPGYNGNWTIGLPSSHHNDTELAVTIRHHNPKNDTGMHNVRRKPIKTTVVCSISLVLNP
uniref:uncharacterized protein LOC104266280 isoform X1 n=1 Tax=Ciona intestinalis TaxID=7719 RepID=UPI00089DAFFB|nr:uncharacterized protein LOC104266280 isoform X1 [Ciona intestinalis]XP_026692932.1 uncharacterized protein LOC104266280 isoform X1 [Ciona intestinalis]|eukprot:XP_009860387.2 uncharacterized protein LOC104266280 isoform X1 [Ciona intestinalis]